MAYIWVTQFDYRQPLVANNEQCVADTVPEIAAFWRLVDQSATGYSFLGALVILVNLF